MAFRKNWTNLVVSKGEPFKIEYLNRRFKGGPKVTVFEVTEDGDVEVNGHVMDGTQNIVGDLSVSGDTDMGGDLDVDGTITGAGAIVATTTATAADLVATDDLTVGDDATIGGDAAVTGGLTVTGLMKINATSFLSAVVTGEDASSVPQNQALTGAAIGDVVLAVINITDGTDANASYENVITVTNQIQQTATDLTAKQIWVFLGKRS